MPQPNDSQGALVGYARVSTRDQHPEAQTDRLEAAGCERVFLDKASGTKASRPGWEECRRYLRRGDTLVIVKLDRAGRSVRNLIEIAGWLDKQGVALRVLDQGIDTGTPGGRLFFHTIAAIAEFEHALIVERTNDGLAVARARGKQPGRKPALDAAGLKRAQQLYDARQSTVAEIAKAVGCSPATLYRRLGTEAKQKKASSRKSGAPS